MLNRDNRTEVFVLWAGFYNSWLVSFGLTSISRHYIGYIRRGCYPPGAALAVPYQRRPNVICDKGPTIFTTIYQRRPNYISQRSLANVLFWPAGKRWANVARTPTIPQRWSNHLPTLAD
uniref:Uncharacterized protein n=1 Tax=Cacopsylla melanoneura TaxID=428564 RepID=A0A8D8RRJ3_9HEMI